jgi:hypothetical protein
VLYVQETQKGGRLALVTLDLSDGGGRCAQSPIHPRRRISGLGSFTCGSITVITFADDRVLMDALWSLKFPYSGKRITLYRGDSFWNRSRRAYGLSWTDDPDAHALSRVGSTVTLRAAVSCSKPLLQRTP